MNISFPHDKPGIYSVNETVVFPAILDGHHHVSCEISDDALKQCFGATVPDSTSKADYDIAMVAAFEASRARIEAAAAQCLSRNPDGICLLGPEDF